MTITNSLAHDIEVDEVDFDLNIYRWSKNHRGYAVRSMYQDGKRFDVSLHRLILARKVGRELKKSELTDHVNGVLSDNRRANLRIATHQQNSFNKSSQKGSSSGYVGVSYLPDRKCWVSRVRRDGAIYSAGSYASEDEAAWMRDQWALALHGEYARLNFEYLPV